MEAIIIKAKKSDELKFIRAFLKRTKIKNKELDKSEYEDFIFGSFMNNAKTGKTVSKRTVIDKLKK